MRYQQAELSQHGSKSVPRNAHRFDLVDVSWNQKKRQAKSLPSSFMGHSLFARSSQDLESKQPEYLERVRSLPAVLDHPADHQHTKVIRQKTTINDEGCVRVDGFTIGQPTNPFAGEVSRVSQSAEDEASLNDTEIDRSASDATFTITNASITVDDHNVQGVPTFTGYPKPGNFSSVLKPAHEELRLNRLLDKYKSRMPRGLQPQLRHRHRLASPGAAPAPPVSGAFNTAAQDYGTIQSDLGDPVEDHDINPSELGLEDRPYPISCGWSCFGGNSGKRLISKIRGMCRFGQ